MISFLRKARQKLIGGNTTTKYLVYAIGEIFLVVIGILIALQINNSNEQSKNRIFEEEILTQIKVNLMRDKEVLIKIAANGKRAIASTDKILKQRSGMVDDSLKYWLGDVIQFDRFQPLTNGYEVLKSKGLDLVKNRELRFMLGAYYDDKVNYMNKAIQDVEWAFTNQFVPILKKDVVEFKFKSYVLMKNNDVFFEPGETRNLLVLNKNNNFGCVHYINQTVDAIEVLIERIDEELD